MIPATPLTPEIVDQLSRFLAAPERAADTLSYRALRGYLFSIAHSPKMVMPSSWLPRVFGEKEMEWDDQDQAQQVLGWLISVFGDIGQASDEEDEIRTEWLFGLEIRPETDSEGNVVAETVTDVTDPADAADVADGPATPTPKASAIEDARREWASGFHIGWETVQESWADAAVELNDENAKRLGLCLLSLRYFSDPEGFEKKWEIPEDERDDWSGKMADLFPMAAGFYCRLGKILYLQTLKDPASATAPRGTVRVEKGPGRNDPCPCGSGKKFKKCCMN